MVEMLGKEVRLKSTDDAEMEMILDGVLTILSNKNKRL